MVRGKKKKTNEIPTPSWPSAAPIAYEKKILSVICGNTHLHWAVHEGYNNKFTPVLFWRTPPVGTEEKDESPCDVLSRHIPVQGQELIFGGRDAQPTKEEAAKTASLRRVPAISIYVVSTNKEHESNLVHLFQDIPFRMFKLSNDDFGIPNCYEGMGVDRVASIKGALSVYNAPVLLFDGGTALTYSAVDRKGHFMGGGIAPGVASRFLAMADHCSALPELKFQEYQAIINEAEEKNEHLKTFGNTTKLQMAYTVLAEIAGLCRHVVQRFVEQVKETPTDTEGNGESEEGKDKESQKPTVVATGGDAGFIEKMLRAEPNSIIQLDPMPAALSGQFDFHRMKHLGHYGISAMLVDKVPSADVMTEDDKLRVELTGQRVAKEFPQPDINGDTVYRGSIIEIRPGKEPKLEKDWFQVRFDDGDEELFNLVAVYDALALYQKVGERYNNKDNEAQLEEKKKGAKDSVEALLKTSTQLQDHQNNPPPPPPKPTKPTRNSLTPTSTGKRKTPPPKSTPTPPRRKKKNKKQLYLNSRIAKVFEQEDEEGKPFSEIYYGTVDRSVKTAEGDPPLWHISYDDGDEEEFDEKDIKQALKLYEKEKVNDPNPIDPKSNVAAEVVVVGEDDAMDVDETGNDGVETPADTEVAPGTGETEKTTPEEVSPAENGTSPAPVVPAAAEPAPSPAPTPAAST